GGKLSGGEVFSRSDATDIDGEGVAIGRDKRKFFRTVFERTAGRTRIVNADGYQNQLLPVGNFDTIGRQWTLVRGNCHAQPIVTARGAPVGNERRRAVGDGARCAGGWRTK